MAIRLARLAAALGLFALGALPARARSLDDLYAKSKGEGAPHSNAAKLFLSWLLEPAQQIATGTWSGRSDVPPPAGYKPIFSYKVANDYQAFLTNLTKVAELRERFEKYTGPVVNSGGVR